MYKVNINTNSYNPYKRVSKNNWERGTLNDFMEAINNWNTELKNLQEVKWQLEMFLGACYSNCWDCEKDEYYNEYKEWKKDKKITYLDKICDFERTADIKPYGWTQGYFDIDKTIEELENNNIVKIPFSHVYDIRQYNKRFNGCYIEIIKSK